MLWRVLPRISIIGSVKDAVCRYQFARRPDVPVHQNIRNSLGLDQVGVSSASFTAGSRRSIEVFEAGSSMSGLLGLVVLAAVCGTLVAGSPQRLLLSLIVELINKRCTCLVRR